MGAWEENPHPHLHQRSHPQLPLPSMQRGGAASCSGSFRDTCRRPPLVPVVVVVAHSGVSEMRRRSAAGGDDYGLLTAAAADEFSLRSCAISQIAFVTSVVWFATTMLLLQPLLSEARLGTRRPARGASAVLTLASRASSG